MDQDNDTDDEKPFRRIQQHRSVLENIQQTQDNLDRLKEHVREAEWMALGGRGMYEKEQIDRLTKAIEEGMSYIREDTHNLPREYDKEHFGSK